MATLWLTNWTRVGREKVASHRILVAHDWLLYYFSFHIPNVNCQSGKLPSASGGKLCWFTSNFLIVCLPGKRFSAGQQKRGVCFLICRRVAFLTPFLRLHKHCASFVQFCQVSSCVFSRTFYCFDQEPKRCCKGLRATSCTSLIYLSFQNLYKEH